MSQVLVELSIDPIGTNTTSESDYIVSAERVLKHAALNGIDVSYKIGPMSTTLKGELYQMLSLVGQMHEAAFKEGAKRVISSIRIDDRRDKELELEHNVNIVEKKLSISKAEMC